MKKILLAIISICLIPSICFGAWNAYLANPRTKYTPGATLPTDTSLSINVVKGQYAAVQVLTQASGEDVSGVNVACTTPAKGGDSLNAPVIYYQKQHNVYIPSIRTLQTGEYPDPLIPKVDPWYSEERNAFPFNVNRIGPVYPVFGFGIQASASGVNRANTATSLPTIGGTFSGSEATNYHARIDGAGGLGVATFRWTSSPIHIKYVTYVASTTRVIVTTYANHGLSVDDPINITTSRVAYNGDSTVSTVPSSTMFTYIKNCGTSNFWYDGGGTAIKTWNETGITTGSGLSLNNGLTITFPNQTYAVSDEWEFYANTFRNELGWIDIYVPTDAVAGTYTSIITVTATDKSDITLNLSIVVYNIAISKTSTIPVHYMGTNSRDSVGYGHTGVYTPDEDLIKRYVELGLRHRISLHRLAPSLTWNGTSITNWTTHKDWIKPYFEGTWGDGSAISVYNLRPTSGASNWELIVNNYTVKETTLTQNEINYLTAYKNALDAEGWLTSGKIYWGSAEEPKVYTGDALTAIQNSYNTITGISSYFKSMSTSAYISQWIDLDNLPRYVSVFSAGLTTFGSTARSTYDTHVNGGGSVWRYLACDVNYCNSVGPDGGVFTWDPNLRPNMAIEAPASKLIGYYWLNWDDDIRGDLYWDIFWSNTRWLTTANPRIDPWDCIYAFGSYGDGYYIYPGRTSKIGGTTDIPIESLRLKYLRMGLEDYEIFKLTGRDANSIADVQSAVGTGKWYFTTNPPLANNMETARTNILNRLLGQPPPTVVPTITTSSITITSSSTATSGGNVLDAGGGTVSARGVCWSTSINPTTADSKTTDGTGTGVFVSSVTGIIPGITTYLRAYAINEVGTSYGENLTISTASAKVGTGGSLSIGTGGPIKLQ